MNYLQKEYITSENAVDAAARGLRAALECSIKHWEELRDASFEDMTKRRVRSDGRSCALCWYFVSNCTMCILGQVDSCERKDSTFAHARKAHCMLLASSDVDKEEKMKEWREEAGKMVSVLKSLDIAAFEEKKRRVLTNLCCRISTYKWPNDHMETTDNGT